MKLFMKNLRVLGIWKFILRERLLKKESIQLSTSEDLELEERTDDVFDLLGIYYNSGWDNFDRAIDSWKGINHD